MQTFQIAPRLHPYLGNSFRTSCAGKRITWPLAKIGSMWESTGVRARCKSGVSQAVCARKFEALYSQNEGGVLTFPLEVQN